MARRLWDRPIGPSANFRHGQDEDQDQGHDTVHTSVLRSHTRQQAQRRTYQSAVEPEPPFQLNNHHLSSAAPVESQPPTPSSPQSGVRRRLVASMSARTCVLAHKLVQTPRRLRPTISPLPRVSDSRSLGWRSAVIAAGCCQCGVCGGTRCLWRALVSHMASFCVHSVTALHNCVVFESCL